MRFDLSVSCPLPTLRHEGVRIDPLTPDQWQAALWRSPVGVGALTRVDPSIRDAWELPGHELELEDTPGFAEGLQAVLDEATEALRLGGPVKPALDKLVVYGPDGHFAPHRDTLRADGHVATLVVRLRSAAAGGRLWVGTHEPTPDPAAPPPGEGLACTVFPADVPHRIEPVDEGTRVSLVYRVLRDGPPALATEGTPPDTPPAHPTGHTRDGGEVALLAHRYPEGALAAGAVLGDDRALLASWTADGAERIVLAVLEGWLYEHFVEEQQVRARPVTSVLGPPPTDDDEAGWEVQPGARLALALADQHRTGGYRMHTGNEGIEASYRYRAAAAIRWPATPPAERAPAVQAHLAVFDAMVEEFTEAVDEQLVHRLEALAEALRSGDRRRDVLSRLDAHRFDAEAAVAVLSDEIETWHALLRTLWRAMPFTSETRKLLEPHSGEPLSSYALRAGPAATARHAADAGWTRLTEPALRHATAEQLDGLEEAEVARWAGDDPERFAHRSLWRLTIEGADTQVRLPPLPQLEVLHADDVAVTARAADLPRLRDVRLRGHLEGQLPDAWASPDDQPSLFPSHAAARPATEAGVVRAELSGFGPSLPPVCGPRLRALTLHLAGQRHDLSPLGHARGLRRLVLHDATCVDSLPWGRLDALIHLTVHTHRRADGPIRLPAAAQPVLRQLVHLDLQGVDLRAVDLSGCTALHTLHLHGCVGVRGELPAAALRSLALVATRATVPPELPRLEALHVEGPGATYELVAVPPRLRELTLADLFHAELTELAGATELRHLTLRAIDELHLPPTPRLPRLESLTLARLPMGELPVRAPDLRALHVEDLSLATLPDDPMPQLQEVTLAELPLGQLPPRWADSPLRTLRLHRLPALAELPTWVVQLPDLTSLTATSGALTELPPLHELTSMTTLELCDQPLVVDDDLADNLHSAPSLVELWLTWPEPHEGPTPSVHSQLHAVGYRPPQPQAPPSPDGGEEDIPF